MPDGLARFGADARDEVGRTGEPLQADEVTARAAALAAHALGVAGEGERLLQLRPGDDGPAPGTAQPALQQQLAQGLPDGLAGHLVALGEVTLGGQRAALAELVEELGDPRLDGVVLGDAAVFGDAGAHG